MGFDWNDHKFVFRPDGSLRDIYVFKTDVVEWDRLLKFAHFENATFIYDGEKRPVPDSISSITFGECAQLVAFRRGHLKSIATFSLWTRLKWILTRDR